jgi:hypothetical protein
MLFGIKRIRLNNKGLYGNISLHHYLTSFGNDISCNIFLKNDLYNLFFAIHSYQNYTTSFPAIEGQLADWRPIFRGALYISPRVLAGIQPYNQEFKTSKAEFVGLAECKIELCTKYLINPYAEFSLKTAGWIAGNEFLDKNFSCRVGLVSRITKRY